MPQMSPNNWLNLFLMFTFMMIYLITYIHFYMNIINNNNNNNKIIKLNNYEPKFYIWMW